MEQKKKALGRGLEELFSTEVLDFDTFESNIMENATTNEIQDIPINEIRPNPYQPRKSFNEEALRELSESIKNHGVFQPIIVKKGIRGYDLIAGERRLRASKMAGLDKIPAIVKDFSDDEMREIALLENIQRENLTAIELAWAYKGIIDNLDIRQEDLALRIGKSRSSVSNTVRILYLAPDVLELVKQGKLTEGHCKALAAITDQKRQYEMAIRMIERGESVRQAEQKNLRAKKEKYLDPKYKMLYDDIEDRFQGFFGTKVKLDQGKRKGKIIIEYNGNSDLERILDLLK